MATRAYVLVGNDLSTSMMSVGRGILLGAVGATILCMGATLLSGTQALGFWAVLLAVAGTIYIGTAHGLWDLVHRGNGERHWSAPLAVKPYPMACLSFDLVVAGYLAYGLM